MPSTTSARSTRAATGVHAERRSGVRAVHMTARRSSASAGRATAIGVDAASPAAGRRGPGPAGRSGKAGTPKGIAASHITKVDESGPSSLIGRFGNRGKASRKLGRNVVTGLRSATMSIQDAAGGRDGQAGDESLDRLATNVARGGGRAGMRAARTGGRGVTSSVTFMWRHRQAPAKAVKSAAGQLRATQRAARYVAGVVRVAAARISQAVAAVSVPVLPAVMAVIAALLVVVCLFAAVFGAAGQQNSGVSNVPAEYESDVIRAGSICDLVTPSVIAAQIEAESNWNPKAGSSAGAQGIAQFMPSTWTAHGKDGDGDGKADVWNPHDAIWSQGNYMCEIATQIEQLKSSGVISGDSLQLTLAAYNAGLGNVINYRGIPPFAETKNYVKRIIELAQTKYTSSSVSGGGATTGTLTPKLVMSDGYHVNIEAMGLSYTRIPDYDVYQCTWWAAMRRNQIGKPVDAHMGNGGQWNDTAARLGYSVSSSPKPGDVICFEPGVHGSSGYYGHVAVVEQVNSDGSILISQSGTGWMAVVTETISAADLKAMGSGVSFIH